MRIFSSDNSLTVPNDRWGIEQKDSDIVRFTSRSNDGAVSSSVFTIDENYLLSLRLSPVDRKFIDSIMGKYINLMEAIFQEVNYDNEYFVDKMKSKNSNANFVDFELDLIIYNANR